MSLSQRGARLVQRNSAIAWGVATDRRLSWAVRAPAVLALAYVVSPIDLIPDFLPGLGWLDDVLALALAVAITLRLVPKKLLAEHIARAESGAPASIPDAATESSATAETTLPWLLILVGAILTVTALVAAGFDLPLLGPGIYAR